MKRIMILSIILWFGLSLVWGQPAGAGESYGQDAWVISQAPPDVPAAPPCPLHRQEMDRERRMLEAVRITRMTEVLKLSDEQIAKFIPRLKQLEERQRQLRQERAERIKRLSELIEKKYSDKDLKAQLDSLDRLEREEMQRVRQMMQSLDSLLTLEQRARWRIFNERFGDEIREMVREIRMRKMDHRPPKDW